MRELVITNGDVAAGALRAAGVACGSNDLIIPWRDVLYEGPVPLTRDLAELSATRATYLGTRGWAVGRNLAAEFSARDRALDGHPAFDVVTLWFEHDLTDMLQLLQLLDYFAGEDRGASLRLVHTNRYLTGLSREQLEALVAGVKPVGTARLNQAIKAWARYREPDPRLWFALQDRPRLGIKHLWSAVLISSEMFPRVGTGLSGAQSLVLQAVEQSSLSPRQLFERLTGWHDRIGGAFMSDASFFAVLDDMSLCAEPLIARSSGERFQPKSEAEAQTGYLDAQVSATAFGRAVLAGRADHAEVNVIDCWMGGTHITNLELWRYDRARSRIMAPIAQPHRTFH